MDKNTQTNCINQISTTTQYYGPTRTPRTAVAASQQLLQAPRSPESACRSPARKHAQYEHGEAQITPTRHATIADRFATVVG
jgi:hypothetical protein